MLSSGVVDVGIALVYVFVLVSLLVSALNELVAGLLKQRAKALWRGIGELIRSDALRDRFYAHPMILSLGPPVSGTRLTLRPDPRASEVLLSSPDGTNATFASAPSLNVDQLTQPGFYQIEERAGGAPVFSGQVAVNAGAAIESDLRPRPAPPIAGADQAAAAPERQMRDLWPWLALGALAVLMLEWGYIHR